MPSDSRSRIAALLRKGYYSLPMSVRRKLDLSRFLPEWMLPKPPTPPPPPPPEPEPDPKKRPLNGRPRVGIIIPAYNQAEQLEFCIGVLSWQNIWDYVIVVVDDGSTDGTREWYNQAVLEPFWSNRLYYVQGGPHQGRRLGRSINLGAAHLPKDLWLMVVLSPNVLLDPCALETYLEWQAMFPNTCLAGRVDYLPPMPREEIREIINAVGVEGLSKQVRRDVPFEEVPTTWDGPEYRSLFGLTFGEKPADTQAKTIQPEWLSLLNVAYPPRLHWYVWGYDEQMRGEGYTDAEFAERLRAEEFDMVGVDTAFGLHMYHETPRPAEAQRNLDYLIRKMQLHRQRFLPEAVAYYTSKSDWQYWWHYNRERGAEIVSPDGTLWAINGPRTHRLQLPDASWMAPLGFFPNEVHLIAPQELEAFENMGVAADPLQDGLDYLRPPKR